MAYLEHVNVTVADPPKRTAAMLCDLFGWHIRWEGTAKNNGYTVHVGSKDAYVAVYSVGSDGPSVDSYTTLGGLNHIGVVVDDIEAAEARVKAQGFTPPHNHGDYEPGRRFYFDDPDGIEFEVVSYA